MIIIPVKKYITLITASETHRLGVLIGKNDLVVEGPDTAIDFTSVINLTYQGLYILCRTLHLLIALSPIEQSSPPTTPQDVSPFLPYPIKTLPRTTRTTHVMNR